MIFLVGHGYIHTMEQDLRPFDVFASRCPSRQIFEKIFSRWGLLVLARLDETPRRFGEIHQAVDGISDRLLAQTLKILEEEGLAVRKSWAEKPPRVEYWLTPAGMEVSRKIKEVIQALYHNLERRTKESGA